MSTYVFATLVAATVWGSFGVASVAADAGVLPCAGADLRPPGRYAIATARFSPDVPGQGEQVKGSCELTAFRARVGPPGGGSGTFVVPLVPPTPVSEKGRMVFSVFTAMRIAHGAWLRPTNAHSDRPDVA